MECFQPADIWVGTGCIKEVVRIMQALCAAFRKQKRARVKVTTSAAAFHGCYNHRSQWVHSCKQGVGNIRNKC